MLLAIGKAPVLPLVKAMQCMALDQTSLHERNEKKGLGSWQHQDGWGIAYADENNQFKIKKSRKSINKSAFSIKDNFVEDHGDHFLSLPKETTFVLTHARAASVGNVSLNNTHPFYRWEFLFCHNGTITNIPTIIPTILNQQLSEKKEQDWKEVPHGATDSERIFLSILYQLCQLSKSSPPASEQSPQKSRKITLEDIRTSFKRTLTSLALSQPLKRMDSNFILSTKEKSYVLSFHNKYPRYLQMHIGEKDDLTVISSEKISTIKNLAWKLLPPFQLLEIDHATRKICF